MKSLTLNCYLKSHLLRKPSQLLRKTTISSNLTFSQLFSSTNNDDDDMKPSSESRRITVEEIKKSLLHEKPKVGVQKGDEKVLPKFGKFEKLASFIRSRMEAVNNYSKKPSMPPENHVKLLTPLSSHQCSPSPPESSAIIVPAKAASAYDSTEERFMWRNDEMIALCKFLIKWRRNNKGAKAIKWEFICTELERKIKRKCPVPKLKNKYAFMKYDWKLWNFLKTDETNPAKASRTWWERKVKENPEVKKLRRKCLHPTVEDLWNQLYGDRDSTSVEVESTNISVENEVKDPLIEANTESLNEMENEEEENGGDREEIMSKINEIEERLSNALADLQRIRQSLSDAENEKYKNASETQLQKQRNSMDSIDKPRNHHLLNSLVLFQYLWEVHAHPNQRHELLKKYIRHSVEGNLSCDHFKMLGDAKNTLEIGAFIIYSLLCIALAVPHYGKIIVIEVDREAHQVGLPFIRDIRVEHKIKFVEENASQILNDLLHNGEKGTFDFAFVNADKKNFKSYHEALLDLLKVEGTIYYDNTLPFGSVAVSNDVKLLDDDSGIQEIKSIQCVHEDVRDVNPFLAKDPRVGISHVSVEDGITLCRRMY